MKLPLGVLVQFSDELEKQISKVQEFGLQSCQLCSWNPALWTESSSENLRKVTAENQVKVTTFWAGWPGPAAWNFIEGPTTIGLVPEAYRGHRVEILKKAADFAASCNLLSVTTHVGFIPEDPNHPDFAHTVEAIREVAEYCEEKGLGFWFETGQETPVTLLRTIEQVGTENLGINLDAANLILYGKGNPVDALDVFGKYVRDVHAKDGLYPTNGTELGQEVPLGEGKVDFPALVSKLKSIGYEGALTIEREITGEQQDADIRKAIALLEPLR